MALRLHDGGAREARADPRFLLANERTFLAWGRTALALVAAGLAVTHLLDTLDPPGARRLLGLPLIAAGGVVATLAERRRRAVERALHEGTDLPRHWLPLFVTATLVGASLAALLLSLSSMA